MPCQATDDSRHNQKDITECPTCGRTDFDTEGGMKSHHQQVHGESISGRLVSCDTCGTDFRKQRKKVRKHPNHYCSDKCRCKGRRNRIQVDCEECGEGVTVIKSYAEKYDSIYCSNSCRINKFSTECAYCGKSIKKHGYEKERSDDFFCSAECNGKYKQKHGTVRGENNGMWSGGGVNYYGENWKEQRNKTLERDNYRCVVCGMDDDTHHEKYGKQLHVHHVEPLRLFDDKCDANKLENLITMCSVCHKEWEGLMLKPQLL